MGFWNRIHSVFRREEKESRTVSVGTTRGSAKEVWPERNYDNFARETYLKNVTAFAAIGEVGRSAASVPWKVFNRNQDGSRDEIPEDPINNVLVRANPQESFGFVTLKTVSYLAMCGNAFNEKVKLEGGPNKGQIRELYSHRPDRFKFDTYEGKLRKYIYTVDTRKTEWEVDPITGQSDILQLKTFHPLDDWHGAAATEAGAREIDTSNAAVEWNKSLLDNYGRPGMKFVLVGNLTIQQFDDVERHLESKYGGPGGAGKDIIIAGDRGTDVKPYSLTPAEMDFNDGDVRLMKKIAMAYGVPPELLGIESATFNNRKEARLFFWENTIIWWLNYMRGEYNNWLFEPGSTRFIDYVLDDVPAFSEKRDKLWTRASESDFLSVNEKREMVGKDSWGDAGNVILVNASQVPLGMDMGKEEGETEEEAKKRLLAEGYDEDEINEMLGLS